MIEIEEKNCLRHANIANMIKTYRSNQKQMYGHQENNEED